MGVVEDLRDLGYTVEWAQGATPEPVRETQRRGGWAWEGDTEVRHHVHVTHEQIGTRRLRGKDVPVFEAIEGPRALQTVDPTAPGYVPSHMILADDSDEPVIVRVEGFGLSTPAFLDDEAKLSAILESHAERVEGAS